MTKDAFSSEMDGPTRPVGFDERAQQLRVYRYKVHTVLFNGILLVVTFAMIKILLKAIILTSALPAWAAPHSKLYGLSNGKAKLTFDEHGSFKVVSFSDMHFGERNGMWLIS